MKARVGAMILLVALCPSCHPPPRPTPRAAGALAIRVNQVGYLPQSLKIAVVCALESRAIDSFRVVDARDRAVFGPSAASAAGPFGPCAAT